MVKDKKPNAVVSLFLVNNDGMEVFANLQPHQAIKQIMIYFCLFFCLFVFFHIVTSCFSACTKTCHCFGHVPCDPDTGQCPVGISCQPNWIGESCQTGIFVCYSLV